MPEFRKAQVTIDMVVGFMLFVSMVAGAFYYMEYLSNPKQPFEAALRDEGFQIADKLRDNISWIVYRSPVWITSPGSSAWNLEMYFYPDAAIDRNSIAILNENLTEVPSAVSGNYTIWVSNISSGKNLFYLIYTKNTTLSAQSYTTDLSASGFSANNSAINVTFSGTGISGIIFGGSEMLGNGANLNASGTLQNTVTPVRAELSYSNGVSAKVYNNISKIVISSNHSISPVLYLQPGFANYYNGTEYAFSSSGSQFNSILNSTDVYSASGGVAVIGRNLNISIYNTTYREIRLYNVTDFEIFIHPGTYEPGIAERDVYLNIQPMTVGLPAGRTGISLEKLQALASLPYADVMLGAGTSSFNLTVENASTGVGKKIPLDRDVVAINRPVAVLGRLGNITETRLNVATWLGGNSSI